VLGPWLALALLGLACAAGGRLRWSAVAVALGLLVGDSAPGDRPLDDPQLGVEVEGRICSAWRRRTGFGSRSAQLCPEWMMQGSRWLRAPPELRVEVPVTLPPPPIGARVRVRGTAGRFAGFANESAVRPGPWRLRVKSFRMLRLVERPSAVSQLVGAWRDVLDRAVRRAGSADRPGVALARALTLGEGEALDDGLRRALRRSGLAHLLAVSGFHLSVVSIFAAGLAALALPRARLIAPVAAASAYLAAVGPEPSMLRASLMSVLALGLVALRRPSDGVQALALTAAGLAAAQPALVEAAGFRLSFAATLGLLLGGAAVAKRPEGGRLRGVRMALVATLSAQLGALPFTIETFGEISPLSPLWNLLFVPWATLALLASMLWMTLAVAIPPLAAATATWLDVAAVPFGWLENLPPSPWISCGVSGGWILGTALAGVGTVAIASRIARRLLAFGSVAVLLCGSPLPETKIDEVVFLDVGQGDAALIRRDGFVALIDGGGLIGRNLATSVLRPALERRGFTRVDLVVLSHADHDHCRGLLELAREWPIGELWGSPPQLASGCGAELRRTIRGVVLEPQEGERLERGAVRFEVLHAASDQRRGDNADSLVLRVELGGRRFLWTGDLEGADERALVTARRETLHATVLKVAHHGSAGSSTAGFLAAAAARFGVVSAGVRNGFGHPARAALERLRSSGASVVRLDQTGEVRWWRQPPSAAWRLDLPAMPRAVTADRVE